MPATPWTPKSVSDLPLVLCGPMLRRVTPEEVNVFIVLKENKGIMLQVLNQSGAVVIDSGQSYINPIALGQNLYLLNIRAKWSPSLAQPDPPLQQFTLYGYNIFFKDPITSVITNLSSADVLVKGKSGTDILTYPLTPVFSHNGISCKLPAFEVPSDHLDSLKIVHGSCRKSGGEGYDAMNGIDRVLEFDFSSRPQLLCLTGDQIYADDVPDALLTMIMRYAGQTLSFNAQEFIPSLDLGNLMNAYRDEMDEDIRNKVGEKGLPVGYDPAFLSDFNLFQPGLRRTFITKGCQFYSYDDEPDGSDDPCKSHLIFFHEFILMYLFVWSDVLWAEHLPAWDDVKTILTGSVNPANVTIQKTYSTEIKAVSHINQNTEIVSYETYTVDTSQYNDFMEESLRLENLRLALPSVRRVLANVSTLMILDDHEITDDLFFNKAWYHNIAPIVPAGFSYGKQLVTNGLAAYALMQGWGNNPDAYATAPGSVFLADIPNYPAGTLASISDKVFPDYSEDMLPHDNAQYFHTVIIPSKHIEFNFPLTHARWEYEFIFLDTRRERQSPTAAKKTQPPAVVSYAGIRRQINNSNPFDRKKLTIVVNASPFLESKVVEKGKRTAKSLGKDALELDEEDWYNIDDPFTYYDMIYQLLDRGLAVNGLYKHRCLILSGDVHYSFSKSLDFKAHDAFLDHTAPAGSSIKIASLCASSFKNQKNDIYSGTRVAHGDIVWDKYPIATTGVTRDQYEFQYVFGWNSPSPNGKYVVSEPANTQPFPLVESFDVDGRIPLVADISYVFIDTSIYPNLVVNPLPSFEGLLMIHHAERDPTPFDFIPDPPWYAPVLDAADRWLRAHRAHALVKDRNAGRSMVGKNNFGVITFNWIEADGVREVKHTMWWQDDDWSNPFTDSDWILPQSVYTIDLNCIYG